jgi:pimeloyl-ACP methyl ester carboxylesterase
VLAQTSLGPVEYAVVGEGTPVVVVHGSPGGIDAAALMSDFLPQDGVRAVLLSRPGYLGTELGERATIDQQADLLAALLEQLGIERAGVFSWSGGGPAGYRLAVRHPERVSAVVAFAAVSRSHHSRQPDPLMRFLLTTGVGRRLLRWVATNQPRQYVAGAISGEGHLTRVQLAQRVDEVLADPVKRDFVLALGSTAEESPERRTGYANDLRQFEAIVSLELERISAPTLVIHGDVDSDVPPAHGAFAAATIPGAELLTMPSGTHLALYTDPGAEAAQARVVEFLTRA